MTKEIMLDIPIPISKIGHRYLLFNVDAVTFLRRVHHICGTPIGTLPQIPQQNLFLGLPIELMREEVKLLTDIGVAYIVDDSVLHKDRYALYEDQDRNSYIESLRKQGLKVSQYINDAQRKRREKALAQSNKSSEDLKSIKVDNYNNMRPINDMNENISKTDNVVSECNEIFSSITSVDTYADYHLITPSTSYISTTTQDSVSLTTSMCPSSYALFKHLHDLEYFVLPGLRFGCDYNVYPGDPLRFHSHFIAVGYKWEQSIPTFDIIGGGRLGTAVKKGFLIGGYDEENDQVRTFTVEWGGM